MKDLKEKVLEQEKSRKAMRVSFYKSEYCKTTHKNVRSVLITLIKYTSLYIS